MVGVWWLTTWDSATTCTAPRVPHAICCPQPPVSARIPALTCQSHIYINRFTSCSLRLQEEFVSELVGTGILKAAALAVRALQLTEEFPEVEPRYRRATVRQLLARGRWGVAIDFARHDGGLQLEVRLALLHSCRAAPGVSSVERPDEGHQRRCGACLGCNGGGAALLRGQHPPMFMCWPVGVCDALCRAYTSTHLPLSRQPEAQEAAVGNVAAQARFAC